MTHWNQQAPKVKPNLERFRAKSTFSRHKTVDLVSLVLTQVKHIGPQEARHRNVSLRYVSVANGDISCTWAGN
jgi:hypothetical protein